MASTSHSSAPAGPASEISIPKYSNWLAVGHALVNVLCKGLRPYVTREMDCLYKCIKNRVADLPDAGPCQCKTRTHKMEKCAWACELQFFHHRNKPHWKQSDPSKWADPDLGPWEIAKLYIPELSPGSIINGADDMDITGILNLMYWCNKFKILQTRVEETRKARNTKWAHVPKLELTDEERKAVLDAVEKLLEDSALADDSAAKKARDEILQLKCDLQTFDLQTFEHQVLIQHRNVTEKDVSNMKNELKILKRDQSKHNKRFRGELEGRLRNMRMALENVDRRMQERESKHNKRLRMQFRRLRNTEKALENVNRGIQERVALTKLVQNGMLFFGYCFIMCSEGLRARLFVPWLIILFLCNCFTSLDPRSFEYGSVGPYQSIGCYKDFNDRAIPTLEGQDSILDGKYNARSNSIEKCYKAAKKRGFQVFAVQNGGWCASSAFAIGMFTRYGKSSACKSDGEGGPWANQVYYIKGYQAVGCYTDTSNRAVETLEGKDSILDGAYSSRVNPIAKCAVAAMRKGYNMFAVQDGGWCAASSTAPQTFDKYGKSTACKGDGKGGPWANNVYVVNPFVLPYETIGCFQDHDDRAIPTLEGQDPILDRDYKTRLDPISKCFQAAKKRGFRIFAIQAGGWCATSASAAKTFNRYGKSSACKSDGEGGPWANQVYYIKGYKAVGCYKNNSNDSLLDMVSSGIETLEGKDSSLDDAYNSRENPIANCAVAAMRNGYSMFAVQNGGWCAASAAALEIFDKYGESTDCEANGSGGPPAYNIYLLKGYVAVGCYREKQDRAIDTLEGKDSILNDSYYSRENPIAKCAVAAMRKGYSIFAVQDGGLCAAGVSAPQKFDKYGKSPNCEVDGTGGPGAINVYLMKEYEDVGCYKDKQDRAIETLEGKDSILDGEYNSRANPIAKCAVAAMRKGYSMFAIQNGGWCAASSTAQQTFDKYGKSTNCMIDGEGGPWANNVYILRDEKRVGGHDNSSSHMVQPLEERTRA